MDSDITTSTYDTTKHSVTDKPNIHLQMTTFCNMGCVGCYQEELSSRKSLSYDDVIDNLHNFLDSSEYEGKFESDYRITFFGGEPLLAFYNIELVLNHIKEVLSSIDKSCYIPVRFERAYRKYKNLKEISIPTSGGKKGILLKKHIDDLIEITKSMDVDLIISVSHDGINNKVARNVPAEDIIELYDLLFEKEKQYGIKLIPNIISTVIPQNITEDYFLNNLWYFSDKLDRPCTFTFPHLLDKTGNLYNDPKIFRAAVKKVLTLYGSNIWEAYEPKIFKEVEEKIWKNHNFNWCGAGASHFAVLTTGEITSCEFIKESGPKLLNKMDTHCDRCEIQKWCQRPCLKNMEVDEELFLAQCTLRKILFNEIATKIKEVKYGSK